MEEARRIELRQYITNGFVRGGISYFGYGTILSVITIALGYGTYIMHEKNATFSWISFNRIGEYALLVGVGILIILSLSIFYSGIKSFQNFKQFMLAQEVKLAIKDEGNLNMPIGIALNYLNEEQIVYENRHVIITNQHVIILEGEPCIQPRSQLKAAYINFHDLDQSESTKLYDLKTVALVFQKQEIKKITCHYIEEAKDILNALKEQGVHVYHGIDSYEKKHH